MKRVSALVAAVVLLITVGSATVSADEYYACDDGQLIRVKTGQLAAMAKSEPCLMVYVTKHNTTVAESRHVNGAERVIARKCRTAPPSSGPTIGTRCRGGEGPQSTPVAQARPVLRGPAGTDDDALPLAHENGGVGAEADAGVPVKVPRKVQGRLADARDPAAHRTHKPVSAKDNPGQGDLKNNGLRNVRILNAKPAR